MKKLVLFAAGLGLCFTAFAQRSQVRTAKNYLGEKNFEKAKAAIEEAVANEDTKDDPYAWHTRGIIYLALQQQPENADKPFYIEAGKSFKKVVALKPDYEREDVNNRLFGIALYNFNAGITAYNNQAYDKAYDNFSEITSIHDLEGGKRFTGKQWVTFDTVAKQAALYQGYSAYYSNKLDEALPVLEKLKNDPIVKSVSTYQILADIYEAKKDEEHFMSTLAEAKKEYPNDKILTNRELNYYIKAKKSDVLIAKLEEAIKADPGNADMLFRLGITYDNMANPKDANNVDLPKPANYAEVFTKAEQAYLNTLKVADKPDYNYNLGALYYNRAVVINDQMNAIEGTSSADLKKLDELKGERDQWFGKALPYLEKAVAAYEPKAATLTKEDRDTYVAAILAAREIFARQSKLEKAAEYKKKFEEVNK